MQHAVIASISQFQYAQAFQPALKNIDLRIQQGEFVVVTGRAGSGRTTLCACLAGVVPHAIQGIFEGSVSVNGINLTEQSLPRLAGLVGLVMPQPENQLFNLTVEEDVAFGPENLGLAPETIHSHIEESLAFVGMEGFRKRNPSTLSGGEMQRVVLASVLAMNPALLVLDQPASALDPLGREQIYENVFRLNRERGMTIVVVEDRLDDVWAYASRMILMQSGQIVCNAPSKEFFADERVLTSGIRLPAHIQGHEPTNSTTSTSYEINPDAEQVKLEKLSFRYPKSKEWAIREITLSVKSGEFVAIVGSNGAGKTTLTKHLIGLLKPTTGRVMVAGQDTRQTSTARLADKVGYLFQDPDYQIFANSVFDEVAFGLKIKKISKDEVERRVKKTLEQLGLLECADSHPYRLSRGQRQRLALATILVRKPHVLVVDEPASGLDYMETLDVMYLLSGFRACGGTVIMITHDMDLVTQFATRTIMLDRGEVQRDVETAGFAGQARILAEIGTQ
jgi:energy-coupling factor transport system ATP-binding protein